MIKCCICNKKIEGKDYNAQPFKNGRCCEKCFTKVVEYRVAVALGRKRPQ